MLQALRKQHGFTIIEVLIVLAIAALIMLIVFLAVPALQRNSRNNGRNGDASRLTIAVRECLINNGFPVPPQNTCDVDTIEAVKFSQLDDFVVQAFFAGSTSRANVVYGFKCSGTGWVNTGNQKEFIVIYQNETTGDPIQRCIDG